MSNVTPRTLHVRYTDGTEQAFTVFPIKIAFTRDHVSFSPEYEDGKYIAMDDIEELRLL